MFKVLAVNDDKDFCECCGKKGLKKVVWIEDCETGEIKHFGTNCAISPAKGFDVTGEVKAAVARFSNFEKTANYLAHCAYRAEGGKYASSGKGTWAAENKPRWEELRQQVIAKGFNY